MWITGHFLFNVLAAACFHYTLKNGASDMPGEPLFFSDLLMPLLWATMIDFDHVFYDEIHGDSRPNIGKNDSNEWHFAHVYAALALVVIWLVALPLLIRLRKPRWAVWTVVFTFGVIIHKGLDSLAFLAGETITFEFGLGVVAIVALGLVLQQALDEHPKRWLVFSVVVWAVSAAYLAVIGLLAFPTKANQASKNRFWQYVFLTPFPLLQLAAARWFAQRYDEANAGELHVEKLPRNDLVDTFV